ncbi:DUF6431 domain-containing protein [Siminovitchia sp. 179-K 8D1 HS]|uniref:DUF6431 domain-containing protein n=1 Tax=Siminovitchia sp. 179-K 8D1 HS TaxID=3142385 RepID=UPI00399FDF57
MNKSIVKPLGKNVNTYLRKYGRKSPNYDSGCPCCGGKPHKHGHYKRTVVLKHSEHRIPIYRMKCSVCGITFSLMPDFLIPYHIYAVGVMESTWYQRHIGCRSFGHIRRGFCGPKLNGPSKRTMKRWLSSWKKNIDRYVPWGIRQLLLYDPFADLQWTRHTPSVERAAFTLTKRLWRMVYPESPYPFYGFFPWINQLMK